MTEPELPADRVVGVGPWPGEWPTGDHWDPELLREGGRLLQDIDAVANRVRRVASGWETQLTIAVDNAIAPRAMFDLMEAFYALRDDAAASAGPPTRIKLRNEVLSGTWEARERVMVALTGAPGGTDYADALLADFDGYRGWIAEEHDGRPVGCVLAHRVRKLPTLGHVGRPEWWYVQQVFVSTDRRREGVGRRLLHAVQEAATAERVRWVRLNSSDAGRPLFDAVGFTGPVDRLREWVPPKA